MPEQERPFLAGEVVRIRAPWRHIIAHRRVGELATIRIVMLSGDVMVSLKGNRKSHWLTPQIAAACLEKINDP